MNGNKKKRVGIVLFQLGGPDSASKLLNRFCGICFLTRILSPWAH